MLRIIFKHIDDVIVDEILKYENLSYSIRRDPAGGIVIHFIYTYSMGGLRLLYKIYIRWIWYLLVQKFLYFSTDFFTDYFIRVVIIYTL